MVVFLGQFYIKNDLFFLRVYLVLVFLQMSFDEILDLAAVIFFLIFSVYTLLVWYFKKQKNVRVSIFSFRRPPECVCAST